MNKILIAAILLLSFFSNVNSQPAPARLIIRGDDMGYAHSGNEAIIECYKNGIERSVEIIVPSPWFPEAVKLLQENPGIDVGIHLALTSEWDNVKWRPVSNCTSLKDAEGYFFPMVWANKNYPGLAITENKWTVADVEMEFRAQVALAMQKLPRITHISAHMGCTELNDSVRNIARRIAQEYKIDIDLKENGVTYISYKGPHTTAAEKVNSFIAMLGELKPGNTYLFVDHPGLDGPELQAIHHIGYENVAADRQGVTDLFTSKAVKEAIAKLKITLISYKQVPGSYPVLLPVYGIAWLAATVRQQSKPKLITSIKLHLLHCLHSNNRNKLLENIVPGRTGIYFEGLTR